MSNGTKSTLVSALVGAAVGILSTALLSLLLVGNSLHALENTTNDKLGALSSRVSSLETAIQYLRAENRTP